MKKGVYLAVTMLALVAPGLIWGQSNIYPYRWGTSLAVQAGRLADNAKRLGTGNLFRTELYTRFSSSKRVLDLVEFGLGVQYYDKDYQGFSPYEVTIPEVGARVTKDQLTDYFVYLATRFNVPTPSVLRSYVGNRIGIHYLKRAYEWDHLYWNGDYNEVTPMNDNFSLRSFGFDFYLGARIAASKLPVGFQGEFGVGNIMSVRGMNYTSVYATIGVYLEH